MDANRLIKDELLYELSIRNLNTVGSHAELRKRLHSAVAQKIKPNEETVANLNEEEELDVCTNKLGFLVISLEEFEGVTLSNADSKRLDTRFIHLRNRLNRLKGVEAQKLSGQAKELHMKLIELSKAASIPTPTTTTTPMTTVFPAATITKTANPTVTAPILSPVMTSRMEADRPYSKDPKIYKWGIKFSGGQPGMSLGDFLDEVEDKRRSRNITEADLFSAAFDLFAGTARIWLRANPFMGCFGSSLALFPGGSWYCFYLPKSPTSA